MQPVEGCEAAESIAEAAALLAALAALTSTATTITMVMMLTIMPAIDTPYDAWPSLRAQSASDTAVLLATAT